MGTRIPAETRGVNEEAVRTVGVLETQKADRQSIGTVCPDYEFSKGSRNFTFFWKIMAKHYY